MKSKEDEKERVNGARWWHFPELVCNYTQVWWHFSELVCMIHTSGGMVAFFLTDIIGVVCICVMVRAG